MLHWTDLILFAVIPILVSCQSTTSKKQNIHRAIIIAFPVILSLSFLFLPFVDIKLPLAFLLAIVIVHKVLQYALPEKGFWEIIIPTLEMLPAGILLQHIENPFPFIILAITAVIAILNAFIKGFTTKSSINEYVQNGLLLICLFWFVNSELSTVFQQAKPINTIQTQDIFNPYTLGIILGISVLVLTGFCLSKKQIK